ncbi:hypothetical protein JCM24511_06257 [Saitozyma sp. JCM 24511]|nr:hypothetical protein JCM24511_06257 [Saitozyma sp. JCM 24511]
MTAPAAPSPASPSPSRSLPLPSPAPLPAPGSPNFVPQLVSHAHTHLSPQWDFDTSLFSAVLLALIVGSRRGGVVVDVLKSERGVREEVGKVVGAVQGVSGVVSSLL